MNAVILDLETVPDLEVWQPAVPEKVDMTVCSECEKPLAKEEADVRKCEAMKRGKCRYPKAPKEPKDEFPPPYAHKIVCCGALMIQDKVPRWLHVMTANPNTTEEDAVLRQLNELMLSVPDARLVTWNGRGFDLPVIEARSYRHGITQSWYAGIYDKTLLDLQYLWPNRIGGYTKMHEAARLIGLPGKNGIDGTMVRALVEAGQMETAKGYCATDVVQTAYLYFRHCLVRGQIDLPAYKNACDVLSTLWLGQRGFEDFVVEAPRLAL